MAVLENLLPGKKYAKFVKFFSGIVLILLVLQPFAGSRQLEEVAARYYEAFVFQNQAGDLKEEILGVEKQRLEQIFTQYEQAIENDVSLMAEDAGFIAEECRAAISKEEGSEQFGTVTGISLKVCWGEEIRSDEEAIEKAIERTIEKEGENTSEIIQIEPIDAAGRSETENGKDDKNDGLTTERDGISRQMMRRRQEEARAAAGKLRRKIAAYYNLEDNYVEIQIVEGKR